MLTSCAGGGRRALAQRESAGDGGTASAGPPNRTFAARPRPFGGPKAPIGLVASTAVSTLTNRQLIPPVRVLAGNQARLFLTSATLLFVELLLIRWIPANVIYVGFFSNFILMASFLGIGLGILLEIGRAHV